MSSLAAKAARPLVCFAVPQEARPFRRAIGTRRDVDIIITGMGRANAERAVRQSIDRARPSQIFTCGFAGALDASLRIGDVLFTISAPGMAAPLEAAGARRATFCCTARVAVTAKEKRALREETQAAAVEMESEAIQAVAHEWNIPCTTLRTISDVANEDLALDFNSVMGEGMVLSPWKLAVAIARKPGSIPALMRLGRNSAAAAGRLAEVLLRVIPSPP